MNERYPWSSLKRPGDHFVWSKVADENSLRAQAVKQGKKRRVVYSVAKVRAGDRGHHLIVTYVRGLL